MARTDQLRVLLVEDDPDFASMYRLKLQQDDYVVEVACDGAEALDKTADSPPDLIFLDIRLPKLDGLEVLERLRAQDLTRNTPVVLLSNLDEAELKQRGKDLGALEYIVKSKATPTVVVGRVPVWTRGRT